MLAASITMAMASIFLVGIWNVCYFYYCYKEQFVYAGMDIVGYTLQSRKAFIVWSLFLSFAANFLFAYFQCVVVIYKIAKDGKDPEKPGMFSGGLLGGNKDDMMEKENMDKNAKDDGKK